MSRGSCDTCFYFTRIKDWVGRVGICDYDDGSVSKVIKQCPNYKGKKYKREKNNMGSRSQGGRGSGCKCNFVKAKEPNTRGHEYIECTKCGSVVEGSKITTFEEIKKPHPN